jgi:hypothetical protein
MRNYFNLYLYSTHVAFQLGPFLPKVDESVDDCEFRISDID